MSGKKFVSKNPWKTFPPEGGSGLHSLEKLFWILPCTESIPLLLCSSAEDWIITVFTLETDPYAVSWVFYLWFCDQLCVL